MDAGKGLSATHGSGNPPGGDAVGTATEPEGGERWPAAPASLFSRAGGQGLLPSSLPLRSWSLWQEVGRSADSHGEGISESKGEFPRPYCERRRSAFPRSSPPTLPRVPASPAGEAGRSPRHPHAQRGGKPAPRRALAPLPLPLNPPTSSGGRQPASPSPWSAVPLVPAPATPRARPPAAAAEGCSEDHSPVQLLCPPGSLVPCFQVLVLDFLKVLQQLRVVDVGG